MTIILIIIGIFAFMYLIAPGKVEEEVLKESLDDLREAEESEEIPDNIKSEVISEKEFINDLKSPVDKPKRKPRASKKPKVDDNTTEETKAVTKPKKTSAKKSVDKTVV